MKGKAVWIIKPVRPMGVDDAVVFAIGGSVIVKTPKGWVDGNLVSGKTPLQSENAVGLS